MELSFKLKLVSSAASFGLIGKFDPAKYPSVLRSSVTFFRPSSRLAISFFLVSPMSQSLA